MASKEELFISIGPDAYRETKSNILSSQADLLTTLKRLHNLKVLVRQKNDLKKRLQKLLSSTLREIDLTQDNIPTSKIPASVKEKEEEPKEIKESFSKRDDIEDELKLIQEKLRELNG